MVADPAMFRSLQERVEQVVTQAKEKWNSILTESFNAVSDDQLVGLAQSIALAGMQNISITLRNADGSEVAPNKPLSKDFIEANFGFLSFCERVKEAGFVDPEIKTGHANNSIIALEMDLAKK